MSQIKIASHLESNRNLIVELWTNAVRSDTRITSDDDLSPGGLVDHVPTMIEEICEFLRAGLVPLTTSMPEARVHAYLRFHQGYRARDMVRETAHLRLILHDSLVTAIKGQAPSIEPLTVLEASRSINLYLDEELRYAMAIYTESKAENGQPQAAIS
jgi:hypothetical protein